MRAFMTTVALSLSLAAAASAEEDLPVLRVAAQVAGTLNWELQTILHHELDRENGFRLELMDVAGSPAAQVAFQGGEADVILSDWIWVARQRAESEDVAFIPYSIAIGGVMVPADSDAQTLEDLRGEQIGIAGGPLDKGWIILQALARQRGWDLAAETTQVFGAPPIVYQAGVSGEVAAAVNFWHFMAKQEAAGMRHLMSLAEAAAELGLDPATPLLGYIVKGETMRELPEAIEGLAAASREAKELLRESDANWERLRPLMGAESDAEFEALREGWRAGIPEPGPVDEESVAQVFAIMADLGGSDLVGSAETLPDGVFAPLGY
jgi:NitT/TauT family transport system substrate-binding protein